MKSNIYKIRIDKCDNPRYWYNNCIGNIYYAAGKTINGTTYFVIINDKEYQGELCRIQHATVIEQITKVNLYN